MIDESTLESMSIQELVNLYSSIIKVSKKRKLIRTKNFIGEIGESLVIEYYNNHPKLPKLIPTLVSTENVDAISKDGKRYSIKTISSKTTGVFYGLQPKDSSEPDEQKFEYVVIVSFNKDYELVGIYEITWDLFFKYKKWHSRMSAWNITLTKSLLSECRVIYSK